MSTTTYIPLKSDRRKGGVKTFFRRLFDALVESRTNTGREIVEDYLRSLSDRELKRLNLSESEIAEIKSKPRARAGNAYWF